MKRIRRLEQLNQIDANLLLTFADGKQVTMLGSASHFFRIADLLHDPDVFNAAQPAGTHKVAVRDLDALRRAISIEGDSGWASRNTAPRKAFAMEVPALPWPHASR